MPTGLLGAFAAALCYGVGSVLQSLAASRGARADGLDPRLVLRLLRSWPYVVGLGLDGVGFLLSIGALQTLPLFAVQAIVAGSLAVTAVVGASTLHLRLTAGDRAALVGVVAGLGLLGASAAEDRAVAASGTVGWGVLTASVLLGLLAIPAGRLGGGPAAPVLGAVAGLGFGAVAVAARILPLHPATAGLSATATDLVGDPAAYGLLVAAGVALVAYATALQRGSVLAATAPLVVAETVVPALVGLLLLGDRARPGWGVAAVAGFVLAVSGALALSRHGELTVEG